MTAKQKRDWPPWWEWELEIWTHAEERMEDRGFTEVELRRMMEKARWLRRLPWRGRWAVETTHQGARWQVIVKPDGATERLEIITAYPVKRPSKGK